MSFRNRHQQRGLALIVGLILLTLICILSLAGMRGIGIQEQMARNLRDRNLAFQAAESALRAAEEALQANPSLGSTAVATGADPAWWRDCWAGTIPNCPTLTTLDIDLQQWGVAARPGYRIERLSAGNYGSLAADESVSSAPLNRITALGVGGTAQAVVILQTTFMP
jgi:type IV pilus assembly protein PilX